MFVIVLSYIVVFVLISFFFFLLFCIFMFFFFFFFFQAEDGIRDHCVTGVQTCAHPIFAFSGFLLTLTRPGVFYSGDAGVKFLLVEQFARGEFHSDLRLAAVPWVRDLWAHGFYAFEPPFVYEVGNRHFACYPVPFLLLAA